MLCNIYIELLHDIWNSNPIEESLNSNSKGNFVVSSSAIVLIFFISYKRHCVCLIYTSKLFLFNPLTEKCVRWCGLIFKTVKLALNDYEVKVKSNYLLFLIFILLIKPMFPIA